MQQLIIPSPHRFIKQPISARRLLIIPIQLLLRLPRPVLLLLSWLFFPVVSIVYYAGFTLFVAAGGTLLASIGSRMCRRRIGKLMAKVTGVNMNAAHVQFDWTGKIHMVMTEVQTGKMETGIVNIAVQPFALAMTMIKGEKTMSVWISVHDAVVKSSNTSPHVTMKDANVNVRVDVANMLVPTSAFRVSLSCRSIPIVILDDSRTIDVLHLPAIHNATINMGPQGMEISDTRIDKLTGTIPLSSLAMLTRALSSLIPDGEIILIKDRVLPGVVVNWAGLDVAISDGGKNVLTMRLPSSYLNITLDSQRHFQSAVFELNTGTTLGNNNNNLVRCGAIRFAVHRDAPLGATVSFVLQSLSCALIHAADPTLAAVQVVGSIISANLVLPPAPQPAPPLLLDQLRDGLRLSGTRLSSISFTLGDVTLLQIESIIMDANDNVMNNMNVDITDVALIEQPTFNVIVAKTMQSDPIVHTCAIGVTSQLKWKFTPSLVHRLLQVIKVPSSSTAPSPSSPSPQQTTTTVIVPPQIGPPLHLIVHGITTSDPISLTIIVRTEMSNLFRQTMSLSCTATLGYSDKEALYRRIDLRTMHVTTHVGLELYTWNHTFGSWEPLIEPWSASVLMDSPQQNPPWPYPPSVRDVRVEAVDRLTINATPTTVAAMKSLLHLLSSPTTLSETDHHSTAVVPSSWYIVNDIPHDIFIAPLPNVVDNSNNKMIASSSFTYQGWVLKNNASQTRWTRRFLKIRPFLCTYHEDCDGPPLGIVPLVYGPSMQHVAVEVDATKIPLPDSPSQGVCAFQLVCPFRTFCFVTENADDKAQLLACLALLFNAVTTTTTTPPNTYKEGWLMIGERKRWTVLNGGVLAVYTRKNDQEQSSSWLPSLYSPRALENVWNFNEMNQVNISTTNNNIVPIQCDENKIDLVAYSPTDADTWVKALECTMEMFHATSLRLRCPLPDQRVSPHQQLEDVSKFPGARTIPPRGGIWVQENGLLALGFFDLCNVPVTGATFHVGEEGMENNQGPTVVRLSRHVPHQIHICSPVRVRNRLDAIDVELEFVGITQVCLPKCSNTVTKNRKICWITCTTPVSELALPAQQHGGSHHRILGYFITCVPGDAVLSWSLMCGNDDNSSRELDSRMEETFLTSSSSGVHVIGVEKWFSCPSPDDCEVQLDHTIAFRGMLIKGNPNVEVKITLVTSSFTGNRIHVPDDAHTVFVPSSFLLHSAVRAWFADGNHTVPSRWIMCEREWLHRGHVEDGHDVVHKFAFLGNNNGAVLPMYLGLVNHNATTQITTVSLETCQWFENTLPFALTIHDTLSLSPQCGVKSSTIIINDDAERLPCSLGHAQVPMMPKRVLHENGIQMLAVDLTPDHRFSLVVAPSCAMIDRESGAMARRTDCIPLRRDDGNNAFIEVPQQQCVVGLPLAYSFFARVTIVNETEHDLLVREAENHKSAVVHVPSKSRRIMPSMQSFSNKCEHVEISVEGNTSFHAQSKFALAPGSRGGIIANKSSTHVSMLAVEIETNLPKASIGRLGNACVVIRITSFFMVQNKLNHRDVTIMQDEHPQVQVVVPHGSNELKPFDSFMETTGNDVWCRIHLAGHEPSGKFCINALGDLLLPCPRQLTNGWFQATCTNTVDCGGGGGDEGDGTAEHDCVHVQVIQIPPHGPGMMIRISPAESFNGIRYRIMNQMQDKIVGVLEPMVDMYPGRVIVHPGLVESFLFMEPTKSQYVEVVIYGGGGGHADEKITIDVIDLGVKAKLWNDQVLVELDLAEDVDESLNITRTWKQLVVKDVL